DVADVGDIGFVFELGQMHADDDQFIRVFALQCFEIGQNVHAVDAAIRPEIEQHDLALQAAQRERFLRIEPIETGRKLRRANEAGGLGSQSTPGRVHEVKKLGQTKKESNRGDSSQNRLSSYARLDA